MIQIEEIIYNKALAEDKIGTMLPCNVIVQEKKPGKIEVSAHQPDSVYEDHTKQRFTQDSRRNKGQIKENIRAGIT
ncbi:DUF302 domain-containing protein [Chitinophaga polysaccharea]